MTYEQSKPLTVYVVVFLTLFMASAGIYTMVYLAPPGHPDSRTYDQKVKDRVYSDCVIAAETVNDVLECYKTAYEKSAPKGLKSP